MFSQTSMSCNVFFLCSSCEWRCDRPSEQRRRQGTLSRRQLLYVCGRQPVWATWHSSDGLQTSCRHSRPKGVWEKISRGVLLFLLECEGTSRAYVNMIQVCIHAYMHTYTVTPQLAHSYMTGNESDVRMNLLMSAVWLTQFWGHSVAFRSLDWSAALTHHL